jgi:hypothetical protein
MQIYSISKQDLANHVDILEEKILYKYCKVMNVKAAIPALVA